MKSLFQKFMNILVVVVVVAAFFVMPAFAQGEVPATESALTVPLVLQALIAAAIGWLVTQGLKSLSTVIKYDLSGAATAITGALVTAVIFFLNALLAAIPADAREPVSVALALLVSILGAYGIAGTVKGFQLGVKK
jgi:hypothetical protein